MKGRNKGTASASAETTIFAEGVKTASGQGMGRMAALLSSELFIDSFACLLLATGLGLASLTVTVADGGFASCFLLALLSLLAILLFRVRWWIAPLATLLAFGITVAYHLAQGDLPQWREFAGGFFQWVSAGAPYHEIYSENSALLVIHGSIMFAISVAVFIVVRRLFFFPLIIGLYAGALIAIYLIGRADLSFAVAVSAAGMTVLLPRNYARYVEKRSEGGERRGAMQLMAVPAAVAALFLSLVFIPEDTDSWRSRGLTNLAADLSTLFKGPFRAAPAGSSNFSMEAIGFQPEGDRLGGPVALTDDEVLRVTSPRTLLLRGAVRERYTGETWAVGGSEGDFRYGSPFWRRYRRTAFGLDKPAGDSGAKKLYASLTETVAYDVEYLTNRYTTLFAGGNVKSARFVSNIDEPPYFNMRSELYLHLRIPSRAKIRLESVIWNRAAPDFDESFLLLEELTADTKDGHYDDLLALHTALPDSLPSAIGEMAMEITSNSETPYQKATAIERWLTENCAYTLEPEPVPEGTDFVSHFLETREGYCTYYASAMAVLARCAGLPSRYVSGFGLEAISAESGKYTATGKTAHAWTEIYFHGIGWLEFDPLRWDSDAPLNLYFPTEEPIESETVIPSPSPADDALSEQSDELGEAGGGKTNWTAVLIGAVTALLAILALRMLLRGIMRSKFRAYELRRVQRKIHGMPERMDYYYADIIRQLALLDMRVLPGETLVTFPKRVDRRFRFDGCAFRTVADSRMRLFFAGAEPTITELETAGLYHENLENLLLERMGRFAYFFQRAARFSGR